MFHIILLVLFLWYPTKHWVSGAAVLVYHCVGWVVRCQEKGPWIELIQVFYTNSGRLLGESWGLLSSLPTAPPTTLTHIHTHWQALRKEESLDVRRSGLSSGSGSYKQGDVGQFKFLGHELKCCHWSLRTMGPLTPIMGTELKCWEEEVGGGGRYPKQHFRSGSDELHSIPWRPSWFFLVKSCKWSFLLYKCKGKNPLWNISTSEEDLCFHFA